MNLVPRMASIVGQDTNPSCSTSRIATQADVDALRNCATVSGDVVLSTSATGSIVLSGVGQITGSLQSEACTTATRSSCDGLTSFSSPELNVVDGGVIFENLTALTEVHLPNLYRVNNIEFRTLRQLQRLSLDSLNAVFDGKNLENTGNVTFSGLSSLVDISLPKLETAKAFEVLDVQALRNLSLSSLTSLTVLRIVDAPRLSTTRFGAFSAFPPTTDIPQTTVEISNANITDVQNIFAGTALNLSRIAVSNVPSLEVLETRLWHIHDLQLHGNGDTSLRFAEPSSWTYDDTEISTVGLLNVSGLSDVWSTRGPGYINGGLAIDTFIAANNNNLSKLDVPAVQNLRSLTVNNNPSLQSISLLNMQDWDMDVIRIVDNPKLLVSGENLASSLPSWVWPSGNVSEMIFHGNFASSFL